MCVCVWEGGGGVCKFSFTDTKRPAMLLLGAISVTMHISGLGDIICCLHFWCLGICLKENGQCSF